MPHQCTQCGTTFADGSKEMLSGCPDCGNNKFQYHPGEVDDSPTGGGADADAESVESTPAGSSPAGSPSAGSPSAGSGSGRDVDSPAGSTGSGGGGVTDRVNRATKTVREWVGTDRDDGSDGPGSSGDRSGGGRSDRPAGAGSAATDAEAASTEDTAQASARSDVVDPDELPDRQTPPDASADASTDAPVGPGGTASAGTESQLSTDDAAPAGGAAAAEQEAAATPEASDAPDTTGTSGESDGAAANDENVVEAPEEDTPDLDELRQELNQQFESIKIVEPGQYELNLMELYDREEYIISLKEDGRYAIEVPETWRDDDV